MALAIFYQGVWSAWLYLVERESKSHLGTSHKSPDLVQGNNCYSLLQTTAFEQLPTNFFIFDHNLCIFESGRDAASIRLHYRVDRQRQPPEQ